MAFHKIIIRTLKPIVERFPVIAAIYRSVRDEIEFSQDAIETPWGFTLAGNASMARGGFEPVETDIVRSLLKDVDVLINIGANVGYYACHALSMGKSVIVFEPVQRNFRYLCRNVKENGWAGVELYPMALSDQVGVLEIYGGDTGASIVKGWAGISENYVALVPSSTLDVVLGNRLVGKKVLVLMDVEGAEHSVLQGAAMMLADIPKPVWMIEISVAEHQPKEISVNPHLTDTFKIMFDAGYSAFRADPQMTPVSMSNVVAAQNGDLDALGTHNFLFR